MDKRSERNLIGVDDKLIMVCQHAFELFDDKVTKITGAKLVIIDGLRTEAEQIENMAAGVSWTMESKHLPNAKGVAEAIDFAVIRGSKAFWEMPVLERVWLACFRPAGHFVGIELEWGGYWKTRDGPHIQVNY